MRKLDKPLVSIITPCYNGEGCLDRYFASILNQTYAPLELIFINDGSVDGTGRIAESYRAALEEKGICFIYLEQENAGQAAALNRGLKLFTGQFLAWPDADDEMTPDCIEKKVTWLQQHPQIRMVRSDGVYYNDATGVRGNIAKPEEKQTQDIFEKLLLVQTYGCCGCYMLTRDLLLECYPDRDIFESRVGQNWQLLVPAASRSLCGYIDEPLYIVWEHGDSHSRHQRTVEEMYCRWDQFAEVLRRAIAVSRCDRDRSMRLVAGHTAREKFYYAVSARDRAMLRRAIAEMVRNGGVTPREWLLFLKCMFGG